jgi:hypothetical protein
MNWKKKIHFFKPVFVVVGLVLLFATMLEGTLFLNKWSGFVAFGVDSVTYYPFNVFSGPVDEYFHEIHYAAIVLMVLSITLPPIVGSLKNRLTGYQKFNQVEFSK